MKSRLKYQILLVLFTISLISSLILSLTPTPEFCDPGKGCDVVHASSYNYTLGVQNSHYGVAIFSILIFLSYMQIKKPTKQKRNLINISIIISSIIVMYFLYLQHFVLKAYCKYCLIVDFSMLISLGVILSNWKK